MPTRSQGQTGERYPIYPLVSSLPPWQQAPERPALHLYKGLSRRSQWIWFELFV